MEFTTKEFAAELNCSIRTVEGWRISRNGKPPVLPPARRNEKNQAVYTEEQLETARAILNRKSARANSSNDTAETKTVFTAETDNGAVHGEQFPDPKSGNNPDKISADIPDISEVDSDEPETFSNSQSGESVPVSNEPETTDNSNTAQIIPTDETPSPVTLEQRADKIRQLQADVQRGIIEIGFELIEAKKEIGHGNWSKWLETEFNWSIRTAQNFMSVAERFGNAKTFSHLNTSTLIKMLALPVGEEQDFIDAQAEAGKPVSEQSAREIQRRVKKWNEQRKPKLPPADKSATVDAVTVDTPENNPADAHVEESIDANEYGGTSQKCENVFVFEPVEEVAKIRGFVEVDDEQHDDDAQILLDEIADLFRTVEPRLQAVTIDKLKSIRDDLRKKNQPADRSEQKG